MLILSLGDAVKAQFLAYLPLWTLSVAITAVSLAYLPLWALKVNLCFAFLGFATTLCIIPAVKTIFLDAGLGGVDMAKRAKVKIAESLGMITGMVYLVCLFFFIPIPFFFDWSEHSERFAFDKFAEFLSALLSICCMILLGFADDVLNLRWRVKLILPTVASLPLLMVYFLTFGSTTVVLPPQLHHFLGPTVNLGLLYYLYMSMLAVFCTNAINILAGVNGVECGQSVVIGLSVVAHNLISLGGPEHDRNVFSLYMMVPFVAVSVGLLYHNWYPASVFVGDTYCYFAGMTFAVVAILGHFSKTVLLFFVPQIFNFVYSVPQLFHLLPCPRHRLPSYNEEKDLETNSYFVVERAQLGTGGRLVLSLLRTFRLAHVQDLDKGETRVSNLTLLNAILLVTGPISERSLTICTMAIQLLCGIVGLLVRHWLAPVVYLEVA
eukprot:gnl/Spiro4/15713_TR8454_c0_g1_i1.p1 gnl/Spiro4/15713_TR8454_c0_g1~~gnl/Spiro4/15713_TR8454_c0_g1_i1.p1  ORF type:complete len:436 (+),score=94.82 gnl/Spiro4/15713_TR8454_c0_g1_i1:126-1433(+)